MNSRFNIKDLLAIITLSVTLTACQDTIPNRSTITPSSSVGDTCTEDESLVTEDLPKCDDDGETVTRPSNAVYWKTDFCACKDTKPVSYGNCTSFCSNKNTNGVETLFANFTVTEAISLSGLGNMYNWCKLPLNDTENPVCEIEAKDEEGNITNLDVAIPLNSNSLTADIQAKLDFDKTYVLTLVERSSNARSNSIQLVKFSTDVTSPILGPLKNAPISQYTCMVREFSTDSNTGKIYYEQAYRLHFYYIPSMPPTAVTATNLICHDIFALGQIDEEGHPRFENLPGVFNVWDRTDPRFYDNNGNGPLDVNELIIQKAKNFGGTIPAGTNFFSEFSWPGSPAMNEEAGNNSSSSNTNQSLGYFMAPWIDQSTFKSYCLTSVQYNSNNALFKAFRDVLQVDTEGLYIGEKSAETVIDSNGNITTGYKDYILIRETDLKQVWFYMNNGTPTPPTEDNVADNAVFFYYPLNKSSPYIKTSTQRLYRVRGASELGSGSGISTGGSTDSGGTSSYPPHDRKIGCVPKF